MSAEPELLPSSEATARSPAPLPVWRSLLVTLGPDVIVLLVFSLVFAALAIVYRVGLDLKKGPIIISAVFAAGLIGIAYFVGDRSTFRARAREVLRDWAPFIALNLIYENLRLYTGLIRTVPIDPELDAADRWLFGGVSPTLWMKHVQTPLLTDFMAFAYGLYFFLPLSIVALIYWRRRRHDFRELALALVLCLYSGFLLFIVFPAGPPRFYAPLRPVFDPPQLQSYFGLWEWSQAGWDSVNPVKIYASFPSLHCAMAMVTALYAWRFGDLLRYRRLLFAIIFPLCLSLWCSTVYLRHHWVVDVFAGWLLGVFCFFVAIRLRRLFERLARAT